MCVCSIPRLSFGGFGKEVCGTLRDVHCSPALETANELACRESGIVRTESARYCCMAQMRPSHALPSASEDPRGEDL